MTRKFLTPISIDHIDFNTGNVSVDATGRLRWNSEEGTLDLGMENEVVQSVGMGFYMPPTKNNSGVSIPAGSFVMATGAQGDRITIAKAVTDGSVSPIYMIGVSSKAIPDESETGLILTNGIVRNVNTNAWPVGTVIYPNPSSAGGLTSTKPTAPNIRTAIGFVLRQHATTGRIYIRMTTGSTLGETDSNVAFASIADGDTIVYDASSQVWVNQQPSGGGGASINTDVALSNSWWLGV
jgi:hypothetical protein